jgi:hypothetical protein
VTIIALANTGEGWNTNPTQPSAARLNDYNMLISHLPPSEKSTCQNVTEPIRGQLAYAQCSVAGSGDPHLYSLWEDAAYAKSSLVEPGMRKGDCRRTIPSTAGASQNWSAQGMSGVLTCKFRGADYSYIVAWSIDQLAISGRFTGRDYEKLVNEALTARKQVK